MWFPSTVVVGLVLRVTCVFAGAYQRCQAGDPSGFCSFSSHLLVSHHSVSDTPHLLNTSFSRWLVVRRSVFVRGGVGLSHGSVSCASSFSFHIAVCGSAITTSILAVLAPVASHFVNFGVFSAGKAVPKWRLLACILEAFALRGVRSPQVVVWMVEGAQ